MVGERKFRHRMASKQLQASLFAIGAMVCLGFSDLLGLSLSLRPLEKDFRKLSESELPASVSTYFESFSPSELADAAERLADLRPDYEVTVQPNSTFASHDAPTRGFRVSLSQRFGGATVAFKPSDADRVPPTMAIVCALSLWWWIGWGFAIIVAGLMGAYALVPLQALRRQLATNSGGSLKVELTKGIVQFTELDEVLQQTIFRLEENQQQQRKAEEITADIVGKLVHDLRLPLSVIKGYLQRHMEGPAPADDDMKPIARRLDSAVERMQGQLQPLLQYRSESEVRDVFAPELSDVEAIARETVALFAAQAEERHMKLRFHCDPSEAQSTEIDRGMISRVFSNLLTNALRFTPPGGSVEVRVAALSAGRIRCTVTDSGMGIPPEKVAQLGIPFFRAHANSENDPGGTGLGLASVHHLLAIHQSALEVRSEVGRGSEFGFTLHHHLPKTSSHPILTPSPVPQIRSWQLVTMLAVYLAGSRLLAMMTGQVVPFLGSETAMWAGLLALSFLHHERLRSLAQLVMSALAAATIALNMYHILLQPPATAAGDISQALLATALLWSGLQLPLGMSQTAGIVSGVTVGTIASQIAYGGIFLLSLSLIWLIGGFIAVVRTPRAVLAYDGRCGLLLVCALVGFEIFSCIHFQQTLPSLFNTVTVASHPEERAARWLSAFPTRERDWVVGELAALNPTQVIGAAPSSSERLLYSSFYADVLELADLADADTACGTDLECQRRGDRGRAMLNTALHSSDRATAVLPLSAFASSLLERMIQRNFVRRTLPLQIFVLTLSGLLFSRWIRGNVSQPLLAVLKSPASVLPPMLPVTVRDPLVTALASLRSELEHTVMRLQAEADERITTLRQVAAYLSGELNDWKSSVSALSNRPETIEPLYRRTETVTTGLSLLLDYYRTRRGLSLASQATQFGEIVDHAFLDLELAGVALPWRVEILREPDEMPEDANFVSAIVHFVKGSALLFHGIEPLTIDTAQSSAGAPTNLVHCRSAAPGGITVEPMERLAGELHLHRSKAVAPLFSPELTEELEGPKPNVTLSIRLSPT